MFFKDKKLFAPSRKEKEIESIEIHSKHISIRFKDTKKDVRVILKSILAINLIYAKDTYSFQIVKKGNKIYEFSTLLSSVTQINQLLHSLVQFDEKVNIFVRNLPYDDRIKLRKWEVENENVLLY
jgi:diaminopimelate epimerase